MLQVKESFKEILVIEDTTFFTKVIHSRLKQIVDIHVACVDSMAAAMTHLENKNADDVLCLSDMNLPDAPNGEAINKLTEFGFPTIVFTGNYSAAMRDKILKLGIIDYVTKESPATLDYLASVVNRVIRNRSITAMVIDDSKTSRKYLSSILERFQLNVITAKDGEDALNKLSDQPDIKLIVTDYNMPNMDGFELIKEIRKEWSKEKLAIIGLSASDQPGLSAKFIKIGADDFINKNFEIEELMCRIQKNLDNLDQLDTLHRSATTDYLTGLYNRRYFYDMGENIVAAGKNRGSPAVFAMIDIDKFKNVNDTYGHDAGDLVLVEFAKIIKEKVGITDLPARLGGEEFCILFAAADPAYISDFFNQLLNNICTTNFNIGDQTINISASIGIVLVGGALEDAIAASDELLYQAKENGRNRAIIDVGSTTPLSTIKGPPGFHY